MREQRRHGVVAVAIAGVLALALIVRPPADPQLSAAALAGCSAHTTYQSACPIAAGTLTDALPSAGAVNYYTIALPAEGEAIQVQLSGAAGLHAALLRDETGVAGPTLKTMAQARPLHEATDAGPAVPGENQSGAPPQEAAAPYPAPFQDTPFQDTPFQDTPFQDTPFEQGASGSRGVFPLQVLAIDAEATANKTLTHFSDALDAPELRNARVVLAVWSPSGGAGSYTLTVQTLAAADTCQPNSSIVPPLPDGYTATHSANPTAPAGAQTVVLTAESLWARYDGLDGQARVMQQLDLLAQQPGVQGAVLAVDADRGVADAYSAWNANRCSATLANAVAARIKGVLTAYLTAHPSIQYVVLAGGDDILPFFRIPDPVRIANETLYAGQSGLSTDSAGSSVFARGDILTDDYYTDPHGALSGEQLLFTEALPLGRLVESPDDITASVQSYVRQSGHLHADSALVTGYDFLKETASEVGSVVGPSVDHVAQLNDDSWGGAQLSDALGGEAAGGNPQTASYQQAGASPDLVFFSGHFAHSALQTAQLDAFRANSLLGDGALSGKLLFTLGCHSGASIPDADADPTTGIDPRDWAQTINGLGGLLIGNTGYGYGDSDVPAYGQELMTTLAQYLVTGSDTNPMPVGEALVQAKQLYRAENSGKWDGYHDKTLMEATLYGLPMYGVSVPYPQPTPANPSLLQGRQSSFGNGAVIHAEVDAPQMTQVNTPRGSYLDPPAGLDIRAFQPVQPQLAFQLPEIPGLIPQGFAVTGATYTTLDDFDPVIVRPMWDVTEPEPQFTYATPVPASLGALGAQTAPNGTAQHNLVLTFGQFVSTGVVPAGDPTDPTNPYVANGVAYPHVVGSETVYSHLSIDVYYGPVGGDQRPPALTTPSVCGSGGSLQIQTQSQRPLSSLAVVATSNGTLQTLALTSSDGVNWSGTAPAGGSSFLQAVDGNGNVSLTPLGQSSGPCASGNGNAGQASSTTTPPPTTPRQRGTVTITDLELAGLIGRVPYATMTGAWGTGGPRCDAAGASWSLAYYVTPPGGRLDPNAQPVMPTAAAPCSNGQPVTWTAQVPIQTAAATSSVCVALYYGPVTTPANADATDCRPLPQTAPPGFTQILPTQTSEPPYTPPPTQPPPTQPPSFYY